MELKDDFYLRAVVLCLATAQLKHEQRVSMAQVPYIQGFFLRVMASQLERTLKLLKPGYIVMEISLIQPNFSMCYCCFHCQ